LKIFVPFKLFHLAINLSTFSFETSRDVIFLGSLKLTSFQVYAPAAHP